MQVVKGNMEIIISSRSSPSLFSFQRVQRVKMEGSWFKPWLWTQVGRCAGDRRDARTPCGREEKQEPRADVEGALQQKPWARLL